MKHTVEIIKTDDGSNTLFIPELNETFHSTRGALTESIHVYIKNGLEKMHDRSAVNILEIGFGTGLNALLTLALAKPGQQVRYFSLEPYPLDRCVLDIYYEGFETTLHGVSRLQALLETQPGVLTPVTDTFSFCMIHKELEKLEPVDLHGFKASLVYYDAFGPSKQPEMWTTASLQKVMDVMADQALLVTYCAQGQFKRNLLTLGMEVQNPPGALGKREMTVAKYTI